MSAERTYHDVVGEMSSKVWRIRDLVDSSDAQKTRSEEVALSKEQRNALRKECKALCEEINTLADQLKAKIKEET